MLSLRSKPETISGKLEFHCSNWVFAPFCVSSDDADNGDRMYDLVATVVHCGATPNRGHYITLVKSNSFWLVFDDDIVEKLEVASMEEFSGMSNDTSAQMPSANQSQPQKNSESAYILFYQARNYAADDPNHIHRSRNSPHFA
uniref:ubiquitinyl hydrolase 1 n=1 Tax=Caenorhabditis japonica TaxID=281687 RepID=A0A8R1E9A9_CAEJA